MQTVWKYPLPLTDRFTLKLPQGALILSIQPQHDQVCLWAMVDPDQPVEARLFRMAGTGHPIGEGDRLSFVATV